MTSSEDIEALLTEKQLNQVVQLFGNQGSLESLSPQEAISRHIENRREELSEKSLENDESALKFFHRYLKHEGIESLDELTEVQLNDFKHWRKYEAPTRTDELEQSTLKKQLTIVRIFIESCESLNLVKPGLHQVIEPPRLQGSEDVSDQILSHERAAETLKYLSKYNKESRELSIWLLFTKPGLREGAIRSLDLEDYDSSKDPARISLHHRPETETRLKNGKKSERMVFLSEGIAKVLDNYIERNRIDNTDDYGRTPLFTTRCGRISTSTIRKYGYMWSRPCALNKECPKGQDPNKCEAQVSNDAASKCEFSRSPHKARKGYITHELDIGVSKSTLSERCDVSEEILDKHYDQRDPEEKMQTRFRKISEAHSTFEPYGGDGN